MYRHGVRRSRAQGVSGNGSVVYGDWQDAPELFAIEIREVLFPNVHRAKIGLDLTQIGGHAWEWRQWIGIDDKIRIIRFEGGGESEEDKILFEGFLVDPAVQWGANNEGCTFTCVSFGYRLLADKDSLVYGRWMMPAIGTPTPAHFSGLPCEFNANGRPNCRRVLWNTGLSYWPDQADGGIPIFTADNDPQAVWWTFEKAISYLQWMHNRDEVYVSNYDGYGDSSERYAPIFCSVEGSSLAAALAAVADKAGYDVYEWVDYDALHKIRPIKRHEGREVRLKKQPAGSTADLTKTNLHTCTIAESSSSCVTAPTIVGGSRLYEITMELQQAWDPSKLVAIDGWTIRKAEVGGATRILQYDDYCKRYVVGGMMFHQYADVGRLWDGNADNRYGGSPISLTIPNLATLAGETESWPLMPLPPLPMLSQRFNVYEESSPGRAILSVDQSAEVLVEIKWNGLGSPTWEPLPQCYYQVCPDRYGIRITHDNLAAIRPSIRIVDLWNLNRDFNLFEQLLASTANISIRMTATVAGPNRHVQQPDRRSSGGTMFATTQYLDRGAVGQIRTRTAAALAVASTYYGMTGADECDGAELIKVAAAVQEALEGRAYEAGLPIEWTDEDIELTDVIPEIAGIGYPLRDSPTGKCPRVIAKTTLLTAETYSIQIATDTTRFNAMLLEPPRAAVPTGELG